MAIDTRYFLIQTDDMTLHQAMAVNAMRPTVGTACVGDSNYTTASGTDDATAIQSILTACISPGQVSVVEFPNNRTYRVGSTITVPSGVIIRGLGGRSEVGTSQPATFVWSGAAGGTVFDVAVDAQNIPMTAFDNICVTGRTDLTNLPATLIKFRGTSGSLGSVDTGTYLRNVWLEQCSGNSLSIEGGATNFTIDNCRWDNWQGYAIYCDLTDASVSMTIGGNTTFAMGAVSNGMIFLDGETSGSSILKLYGLHLETNASLNETFSGGTNPFDKRGLIRLGVNAAVSSVQHTIHASGIELAEPFSISSHSLFQITASSTADSNLDNTRMINLTVDASKGLSRGGTDAAASDEIRLIGGRIHNTERPPVVASGNVGFYHLGIGKNSSAEQVWSAVNTRGFYVRGLVVQAHTVSQLPTDFPKPGMLMYCTDLNSTTLGATAVGGGSNKGYVGYNGTAYKIVAIIN